MDSILKVRLQTSLHRSLAYVQTEIIFYLRNYSFQLKTLEVYQIFIFKFKSLKSGLLNRKLYVDFKNGLNFEKSDYKRVCRPIFPVFLDTL